MTQKIIFIDGEDLEAQKKATLLEFLENLEQDEKVNSQHSKCLKLELARILDTRSTLWFTNSLDFRHCL